MSALRAPKSQPQPTAPSVEVPGMSYYAPEPANRPAPPTNPLTALEQMYGYWSAEG